MDTPKKTLSIALSVASLVIGLSTSHAIAITADGLDKKTSLSLHGETKYKEGFSHFDYVNPDAPKGGILRQGSMGTFDSLNPYIEKGTPAAGVSLIYETLMASSADEPFSLYPLIAQSAEPAPDNGSITFHLNPKAKFHDGTPVTAEDVAFSLKLLKEKGSPFYRAYYRDIVKVEPLSKLSVRFIFANNENPELPLITAQIPVLPKHFWEKEENDFQSANLNIPLGSGPYKVVSADAGRSISLERVKDYWGENLPVNKGRHNFDERRYDYYRDANVSLQALKAGEYDIRFENIARNWATAYDITAVKDGQLKLETIASKSPEGMQGFVFNIRRDVFSDVNVRRALNYAMDFEWLNKNLFYGSYIRTHSYFENSDMKATGIPEGKELALLEPWRKQLPADLFTEPHILPETDGSGRIRGQLSQALALMEKAGWKLDTGKLKKDGKTFEFDILLYDASMEKVALPFKKNLEAMGVTANIRTVDISQYINRLRQFDYDMIVSRYPQSSSPGNEQLDFWGSAAADQPGSRNMIGIKNPVIDALIDEIIKADSIDEQTVAVKALDRVLLWNEYMIPQWYYPFTRVAYWQPLAHNLSKAGQEPLYQFDLESWWFEPDTNAKQMVVSEEKPEQDEKTPLWPFGLLALAVVAGILIKRTRKTS